MRESTHSTGTLESTFDVQNNRMVMHRSAELAMHLSYIERLINEDFDSFLSLGTQRTVVRDASICQGILYLRMESWGQHISYIALYGWRTNILCLVYPWKPNLARKVYPL